MNITKCLTTSLHDKIEFLYFKNTNKKGGARLGEGVKKNRNRFLFFNVFVWYVLFYTDTFTCLIVSLLCRTHFSSLLSQFFKFSQQCLCLLFYITSCRCPPLSRCISHQAPPPSQDAPYMDTYVSGIPLRNIPFLEDEF